MSHTGEFAVTRDGRVRATSPHDESFEFDQRVETGKEVEMRHCTSFIGNPSPLGLICFGMTTVMLMFAVTGWAGGAGWITIVACYAIVYGGFAQMVAGVFELIKGNTYAGSAFISYGAFWIGFFIKEYLLRSQGLLAAQFTTDDKVGECLFYVLWGVLTTAFFLPTLRKNLCLMAVFGLLSITFYLLAGGVWNATCNKAAGYFGFFCGCSAIYTAFAEIYQENMGLILPGLRPRRFI